MFKTISLTRKITIQEGDVLLEKYYDGKTSNAEEKKLLRFLSQENLPERFESDRAIMGYFVDKKTKPKAVILSFVKWGSVAAVFFCLIFFGRGLIKNGQTNYAYINGQKITNNQVVKEQALASLNIISSSCNEIEESAETLNDEDLVQSQLQLFSEDLK